MIPPHKPQESEQWFWTLHSTLRHRITITLYTGREGGKSEYCRCQSRSAAGPKLPPMQASPGYRSTNPSLAAATCMRRDRHPSGADVNTWKYGGPCSAALINQFYLKFLQLELIRRQDGNSGTLILKKWLNRVHQTQGQDSHTYPIRSCTPTNTDKTQITHSIESVTTRQSWALASL